VFGGEIPPGEEVPNMRFRVKDGCIGCALCEETCPAVFRMTDLGVAEAIAEEVAPEHEAAASTAMDNCPAGVIKSV
jgi:ferredoxin